MTEKWKIKIFTFFKKHWVVILLLVVSLFSYGQILGMNFWQDDNAVVFKFTHLDENAGYLGEGVLGTGPYRYTLTPYLPIFHLFGYQSLPYFTLMLFFFVLSVYAVYFFFLILLENKKQAALAGLLYAAGYVASDGFIRMFNSVLTSLSVILVCAVFGFYHYYAKQRKTRWYLWSLLFFLLAIEVGFIRTHYLFFAVCAFETIFVFDLEIIKKGKLFRSISGSLVRLIPFAYFFYRWFLIDADSRSGQILDLLKSLLRGEWHKTYSFFSSFGYMLLSNQFFPKLYQELNKIFKPFFTESQVIAGLILFSVLISLFLVKQKITSFKWVLFYLILNIVVLYSAQSIFNYPGLIGGFNAKTALLTACSFFVLSLLMLKVLPRKKLALFFLLWSGLNLAAYAAYNPIYPYLSDNRYLLHSFIPLIGLLVVWASDLFQVSIEKKKKNLFSRLPLFLVLLWGGINFYSSIDWQREIILHRSNPSKRFFKELKEAVPDFKLGSVFYFYLPDDSFSRIHYDAGFGVAQMPEETAIAWRYGVDRYDLKIVNSFIDLKAWISEKGIGLDQVYAFISWADNLEDVSQETRELLSQGYFQIQNLEVASKIELGQNQTSSSLVMQPAEIKVEDVSVLTPLRVRLWLKPEPIEIAKINLPLIINRLKEKPISLDKQTRRNYLDYQKWLANFYQTASVKTSSIWQEQKADFLIDQDPLTYWEANRVIWKEGEEFLVIDLGRKIEISGLVYLNGPEALTPTEFEIFSSNDNQRFDSVKKVMVKNLHQRGDFQKIIFPTIEARYFKIVFQKTLYNDAPALAELIVLPKDFADLDPELARQFFRTPFSQIRSVSEWQELMTNFESQALIKVSWKTDSNQGSIEIPVNYQLGWQTVDFQIPAGGKKLEKIEILPVTIPGQIYLTQIVYENTRFKF